MAHVVVLGAGVAGHAAAQHLRRMLSKQHEVAIISPNPQWNWIPPNIWVGMGRMDKSKVLFPLHPVYDKRGVIFHQAEAFEIYPEGRGEDETPVVKIEYTDPSEAGTTDFIVYDYLINTAGPKLNFDATPGLGPDDGGNSLSVCTADHADETQKKLKKIIEATKVGKSQRLAIGTDHGTCTCQDAAFEYVSNVEFELCEAGVRDLCEVAYITNEYKLGDFGVGGMRFKQSGFMTTSQLWTESLFRERGVKAISGAVIKQANKGSLVHETLDGSEHELDFDFAMLLPPFSGYPFKAFAKDGSDTTDAILASSDSVKVDTDYSGKAYEDWDAGDWLKTYQNLIYDNLFAAGISFAPPYQISKPRLIPNGTPVAPAPPRTGQPSDTIGRTVAGTIVDRIKGKNKLTKCASMTEMGASCVASTGASLMSGSVVVMVMYPIVPDEKKHLLTGRHLYHICDETGFLGHWIKLMLHYLFIHKAKDRIGWTPIPE